MTDSAPLAVLEFAPGHTASMIGPIMICPCAVEPQKVACMSNTSDTKRLAAYNAFIMLGRGDA